MLRGKEDGPGPSWSLCSNVRSGLASTEVLQGPKGLGVHTELSGRAAFPPLTHQRLLGCCHRHLERMKS